MVFCCRGVILDSLLLGLGCLVCSCLVCFVVC